MLPLPQIPNDFRVLVLEDEYFLARELRDILLEMGIRFVDLTGSVYHALKLLECRKFALGLLDVRIRDSVSFPVADKLISRGVPFAFVSGIERSSVPSRFMHADFIERPYDERTIINGLKALVARAANA